jgi:adenine-specific DNA-methyltransferase
MVSAVRGHSGQETRTVPLINARPGVVQTPDGIAKVLAEWALRNRCDAGVEPSCGEGAILDAMLARLSEFGNLSANPVRVTGIEVSGPDAQRTKLRLQEKYRIPIDVRATGYFSYLAGREMGEADAIVGNPPFLRSAEMPSGERDLALSLLEAWGWEPTRGMNAWVYFLLGSISLLRPGGRIAMVIPAELLQADYAKSVRHALSREFGKVTVVIIRGSIFHQVDQKTLLVLGEKGGPPMLTFAAASPQELLCGTLKLILPANPEAPPFGRWDSYLLPARERSVMQRIQRAVGTIALGECASVDVGVVTGQNSFFLLTNSEIRMLAARPVTRRVLGRTRFLKGLWLVGRDWGDIENESPSNLLAISPEVSISSQLEAYIAEGEEIGLARQYKCSIRDPWYSIPSTWVPDAFLSRQFGTHPRLCVNKVDATCTDTILRVNINPCLRRESVAARFVNSMTFAHAELVGRRYGGGVLELMPRDAERLRIPEPGFSAPTAVTQELDKCLRDGDVEAALDVGDHLFLREQLELSQNMCYELRRAWHRLRGFRLETGN